jgi:osmotically-inducible protein OsmY
MNMKRNLRNTAFALVLGLVALPAMATTTGGTNDQQAMEHQVRHELIMQPFLGVFDNIEFRVEGSTVILSGQTYRPTLKASAERVVARVPGVTQVENNIEVLPLSSFDNRIRLGVLRAVYGNVVLDRYALQVQPPIRIIVKNGNVTLEGVVARDMEKNVAFLRANTVPGVFSVTNHLRVDPKS